MANSTWLRRSRGSLTSRMENSSFPSSFKIIACPVVVLTSVSFMDSREPHLFLRNSNGHLSRVSKLLLHRRRAVNGSQPGAEMRSSRSKISGDGRKSVDSSKTNLNPHETLRLDHSSCLPMNPITLAPCLCIRRWNALCISCA